MLPDLADELGVSRGLIGLLHGAVAIPGIVLSPYIGYLADRSGRRRVIRWSLVIFGIAGVAGFFVRSFWPLVGLRVLQGFGTSGLLSLGVVIVGDLFTGLERRWAMGLNLAGLTLTTTVAPIIGGFLAEGGTFRPFLVRPDLLPLRRCVTCAAPSSSFGSGGAYRISSASCRCRSWSSGRSSG